MKQQIKNIIFTLCLGGGVISLYAQDDVNEITGKVVSVATNSPVAGISVSVKGVSSAMTDETGTFKLKVPSYNVELDVNGPLYKNKRVALKGNKEITIKLQDDLFENSVYKDVSTPLGNINNSHLTSSIEFFDQSKETTVADMPEQLLMTASGLNVLTRSGMEGSGANLFLRGFNSIFANNQPLLVIDGMVIENAQFGSSLIEG